MYKLDLSTQVSFSKHLFELLKLNQCYQMNWVNAYINLMNSCQLDMWCYILLLMWIITN